MGKEYDRETLEAQFIDINQWTFQLLIECLDICLPIDDAFNQKLCKVVLGIFLIDDFNSGLLVRASYNSCIVSVASGKANIGWAFPVTDEQRDKMIIKLDSSLMDEPHQDESDASRMKLCTL